MALSKEQAKKIKEHLISQLGSFPEEKRAQIRESIENLSEKELERFLEQNNLHYLKNNCIFCAIASKNNPAVIIGEDNLSLAVLELNPLSKGHSLIIPKKHSAELRASTERVLKIVSEKISEKFRPKKIQTNETEIMGHPIMELIPIYGDETERKPASKEYLESVKEELFRPVEKKEEPKKTVEVFKAKPRIP